MRADKFVAQNGLYARSEVKQFFKKNRITLNGAVLKDGATHIDEKKDILAIDGKEIIYKPFVYLMLNKPSGYICATEDGKMATVMELVPEEYLHYGVFPVGRLDKDTVGLLLLTNDGELAHKLLTPKKNVAKIYHARVERPVRESDILAFKKGIYIKDDDFTTLPGNLRVLEDGENPLCEVTIYEGKFHQVKRMFQARCNKVLKLKRVKFAGIKLDETLPEGDMRELLPEEEKIIKGE